MVNETNSVEDLVEDLIWAREMLRIFARLERNLKHKLGRLGIEKIVIRNPLFIALFFISSLVSILGVIFWLQEQQPYYLSTLILPFFSIAYIYKNIRAEKNKNLFRFLGKCVIPQEELLGIIEEFVFENKEHLEEIISWRINMLGESEQKKFAHIFETHTWEHIDTAQEQCTILAILMVSLQRFLHTNRVVYDEHVKKLPLMNAGYNYKPTKKVSTLSAEDIQTFGFPTQDTKAS